MEDYEVFSLVITLVAMAIPVIISKIAGNKPNNDIMSDENQPQNIGMEPDFPSKRYVVLSEEDSHPMFDEVDDGTGSETDKPKTQSLKSGPKGRKIIDDPKKMVIYSEIMTPKYKE